MIGLKGMVEKYREIGYTERTAEARVCQDIVLKAIQKSSMGQNVTIKGGVVMRSLTQDVRRATEDIDLDFIRHSIDDHSIMRFISKLNCLDDLVIKIKQNRIEELSQQEYHGKRIFIIISDMTGYRLESKLDIGVHANMEIEQRKYCFDVCMDDEGASLLINSCEQIFTEKLRSLLRFGPLSTRYKDIFDFCYLIEHVDIIRLKNCIETYIIKDPALKEGNMDSIYKRISKVFSNRHFIHSIKHCGDRNWLEINIEDAFRIILDFLKILNL